MMRKIFVILTLLWMLAIFGFSAQDADESSQMSLGIAKAVGDVFVEEYIWCPRWYIHTGLLSAPVLFR